jgi:hypothetical protein
MTHRGGAAILLVLLVACGSSPHTVGSACKTGPDCAFSATSACITTWPGGYCTEYDCQLGSCPAPSRCVTGIMFVDVPGIDAFCLETCASISDCRPGYACVDFKMPQNFCVPQNP